MQAPEIEIGILFAPRITFRLNGTFICNGESYQGEYTLTREGGNYRLASNTGAESVRLPLEFLPEDYAAADFDLMDVTIGIHFHWERQETQKFKGTLRLIDEGEHLTAVNRLLLEDYLRSVISSEMKATSHIELLKAHAVISRSWLLAQKAKAKKLDGTYCSGYQNEQEYIRWYDREDHRNFDVCADDHCQRYQGITRACTPAVHEAVERTQGEVLTYGGDICDARFSKCCGGATERFENTWEAVPHPYLTSLLDAPAGKAADLSREEDARAWILSAPPAFCHTDDRAILAEVLNDYDLETRHFFRWTESRTAGELSALMREKLGIDFGDILDLVPVERGNSGRIIRLLVKGSRQSLTIGKELVIRKALSPTHLYSSAFVVEKEGDTFTFHGAGWGHGVGLCQIGAAVMSAQGYGYRDILQHYFKGSEITKIY